MSAFEQPSARSDRTSVSRLVSVPYPLGKLRAGAPNSRRRAAATSASGAPRRFVEDCWPNELLRRAAHFMRQARAALYAEESVREESSHG
jgi:hypothetical protein